jgi:hypothetical protein
VVLFPTWAEIFLFYETSTPALGPIQSPIQWVLWAVSPEAIPGEPENCGSIRDMGREFSLLRNVHTCFGANPVSYTMGIVGCFPRGSARGVKLNPQLQLVPRLLMHCAVLYL